MKVILGLLVILDLLVCWSIAYYRLSERQHMPGGSTNVSHKRISLSVPDFPAGWQQRQNIARECFKKQEYRRAEVLLRELMSASKEHLSTELTRREVNAAFYLDLLSFYSSLHRDYAKVLYCTKRVAQADEMESIADTTDALQLQFMFQTDKIYVR